MKKQINDQNNNITELKNEIIELEKKYKAEKEELQTLLKEEKARNKTLKELSEEQQKKTKKYKASYEDLKVKNENLQKELKQINSSHPNHTINEEKKEYSDLLGENNNSGNDELFKLREKNKVLQEKLDLEVNRTEALKDLIEVEKQKKEKKIEEIVSQYHDAQDKNNKLINQLKERDLNFNQKLNDEINNYKKNNDKAMDDNEKEKKQLKDEISNKDKVISELSEKINELKSENEKLNLQQNEYEEKIKNLNVQLEEFIGGKFESEEENKNYGYNKLISVMNIGSKDSKDNSAINQIIEGQKSPGSSGFFDKRQVTGQFGGEGDENSIKLKYSSMDEKKNTEKNKFKSKFNSFEEK